MVIKIDDLYERIEEFSNKHSWIQDGVALLPYVRDAQNKIVEISNISNRMKKHHQ